MLFRIIVVISFLNDSLGWKKGIKPSWLMKLTKRYPCVGTLISILSINRSLSVSLCYCFSVFLCVCVYLSLSLPSNLSPSPSLSPPLSLALFPSLSLQGFYLSGFFLPRLIQLNFPKCLQSSMVECVLSCEHNIYLW